jgi:hypothetical protein
MRLRRQGHLAFIRFEVMGPPIPVTFLSLQASWRWAQHGVVLELVPLCDNRSCLALASKSKLGALPLSRVV